MLQIVVMAFPQAAAKIMVLGENTSETQEPQAWFCWGHELVQQIPSIISEQSDQVSDVLIFGPKTYTENIIKELQEKVDIPVRMGEM